MSLSLQNRLSQPYQREDWQKLLHSIFPDGTVQLFSSPQSLPVAQEFVSSTLQLGTITLPDGKTIALLEVETSDQVKLARNRVALRNYVASFIDEAGASAVLSVFHQTNSDDWRLTYAAKQTTLDEDTFEITTVQTAPRRFTFLLGKNEPCRTAAGRLAEIIAKGQDLELIDVEKAFSVEKLSKEFFTKYQQHYAAFLAELLSPQRAADSRARFSIPIEDTNEAQSKADKPIRDFTKKLLGRLIFLAFLQKKGWLHAPADSTDWSTGDRDFLRSYFTLAEQSGKTETFHSSHLAPLFFEALNTERAGHLFPFTGSRMPFLNGGLFEPDSQALQSIDFPPQLFENLFAFFAEYNFTIDENDPEDHEVGIDPEMLGHIFENLLEDNKDKGAYYTPKVIVSYMCRQSILRYLETHLGKHEALTRLCELHEPGDLREKGNWCVSHAKRIATLLETVKICDPAIGSGAFPIGMLNEIVHLRTLLNSELNDPAERAILKKNIIAQCIHGVDLDSGAVDIARLRFWLALVVDEEMPSPLPNLDYKIMQGNSLLESFYGIDLSRIDEQSDSRSFQIKAVIGAPQIEFDLLDEKQSEFRETQRQKQDDVIEAMRAYFAARLPAKKADLRQVIDQKIIAHIRHCLNVDIEKFAALIDQQNKMADGILPKSKTWTEKKSARIVQIYQADLARLEKARSDLAATTRLSERPYFLWHLLFRDVFENGGFDIVIANPPYVRQELIKEQKPLIEQEGYITYTGTADLLVYFYERATTLLKPDGVITFITSNKFYRADYGQKIREYLTTNLTLHTIIDFGEAPIFNGVAVDATVLVGQKETASSDHHISTLLWDFSKPATALPLEIAKAMPLAQSALTADGWRFVNPEVNALLTKLRNTGTRLGEYVNGRFYRGILTGFNEAFVIDGKKRAELIVADPKSDEIIKPFLMGDDVKRWKINKQDLWIIKLESSQNKVHPWTNSTNAWQVFCKTYPSIGQHFESLQSIHDKNGVSHWHRLLNRDDQGSYFWELRSCSYWADFELPKLFYNETSKSLHSFYDQKGLYLNKTLFFLISDEALFIQALLMSAAFDFKYRSEFAAHGNAFQGGRPQFKKSAMEMIPIPPSSDADKARLTQLAEACAQATQRQDRATLTALEAEINTIVYRLFHLTAPEIALIETTLGIENIVPFRAKESRVSDLILPTVVRRSYHDPRVAIATYLREFISLRGDMASLHLLAETIKRLINPDTLLSAKQVSISNEAHQQWRASFPPETFQGFFESVGMLESAGEIHIDRETLVITLAETSTLKNPELARSPWAEYDLELTHRTLTEHADFETLVTPPKTAEGKDKLFLQFHIAS